MLSLFEINDCRPVQGLKQSGGVLGCNDLACGRGAIQLTVRWSREEGLTEAEWGRELWGRGNGGWEHLVVNWTEQGKVAVHMFLEKIWKRSVYEFMFCRVPFSPLPLNELVRHVTRKEEMDTPCQLPNMLLPSTSHSGRDCAFFLQTRTLKRSVWSHLFRITLLLSGRSRILTWVWLTLRLLWPFFQIVSWSLKKSMYVGDYFLLNIFLIM